MRANATSEAFLFHTRLVRVPGALRKDDALQALGRLTLLTDSMGGDPRIGGALAQFARGPARSFVDGRTVVVILSEGYASEGPRPWPAHWPGCAGEGAAICG
jgi:uncharacterized protein with von Willebrand factor type A (vWA) domain